MPIGKYSNFNACVEGMMSEGKSKESATKICGMMEQEHKKKMEKTMHKEDMKVSNISGIQLKEKNGEFFAEGFIATTHPDRLLDIIPVSTLNKIAYQINVGATPDAQTVSWHHNRADKNLIGLGSRATVKETGDGHYGVFVETHLNRMHPEFEKNKYEIENGFVNAFSIEYDTLESRHTEVDGKEMRILEDINLRGYGFASPRTAVNPNAVITGFGEKEIIYKEIVSMEEKDKPELGTEINILNKTEKKEEPKMAEQETVKPVASDVEMKELIELRNFKSQTEQKELAAKRDVELKEAIKLAVKEILPEIKPMLDAGQPKVPELKEFKTWEEAISNEKVSLKEQISAAGRYAEKVGAFKRQGDSVFERKEANWDVSGNGMEFKALTTSTSKTLDTDYYQSAAELNDIYDPIIYSVLNDNTTTYGLLQKKNMSNSIAIQVRARYGRNSSANAYSEGAAVVKSNTSRIKLQQPFKYYQVGVQVTGQMESSSRGAGIGDVFGQEVADAAKDLLDNINNDLLNSSGAAAGAQKGAVTDEEIMSFEYLCDSTTNTAIYGLTRSSYSFLLTGGNDAMASATISKDQLRKMIRTVVANGARQSDLVFFTSLTQKDKILGLFDDAQRLNNVSARAGFEGLPTFDGIPIHADFRCNSDHLFLIDTANTWLGVQVAPTYEDLAKTDDSRSGFIKTYLNLMCVAPNHCYQADGLATA